MAIVRYVAILFSFSSTCIKLGVVDYFGKGGCKVVNFRTQDSVRTLFNGLNPISLALQRLAPCAEYTIRGLTYDDVEWGANNTTDMPSREALDAMVNTVIDDYTKKSTYVPQREQAYPSIQNQLDMLYWDMEKGTTIWRDTIRQIKEQYPKP